MSTEIGPEEGLAALQPLRDVVEVSLRSAEWLDEKVDGAAIELARYYAGLVDAAVTSGDGAAIQKAMAVSGPNLHKTLTSLGLTPAARGSVKGDAEAASVDPFDELKKRRRRAESKVSKEA